MKISVDFKAEKLPVAYRMAIISILKEAIRKGDESTYEELFTSDKQVVKPYATAVYLQQFKMNEDDIELNGFRLHFATSEYSILLPLLNGLQSTNQFQFKNYHFTRGPIHFDTEKKVTSKKVIVRTLSPILVEDKEGKPLSPIDPHYNENFNAIMNRISMSLRNMPLQREIKITPIRTQKRVIKELNHTFIQNCNESKQNYLYFTAYHGSFLIEAEATDIEWMLSVGVGLRRGQSFGLLDLEMEVKV